MKVAVTTSSDRFDEVAGLFRSRGLEPVELPCIAIEVAPPDELEIIRDLAAHADRILVTSARAVRVVWPGMVPAVPFLSVGSASSAAIRNAGGTVDVEGTDGAIGLVELFDPSDLRIVFPHAAGADPAVAKTLRARGATVDARVAYRSVPIAPDDGPVDAVAFASPSAVEGWLLSRSLDDVTVVAIGATTAAAVLARGGSADIVADRPGFEEMAAALHHWSAKEARGA